MPQWAAVRGREQQVLRARYRCSRFHVVDEGGGGAAGGPLRAPDGAAAAGAGYDVRYEEFDAGHVVPPHLVDEAVTWWLRC